MARIEMTSATPDDPVLAKMFDDVRARGITLPNLYRVLGASPEMLKAWLDFAWSLRLDAKTPRGLRELMIMRGAQLSGVAYEWAHHWPMAKTAGVSEEKLLELSNWRKSSLFSEGERAALLVTDEISIGPGASEEAVNHLKEHFAESEVVELTLTLSFYVCVSRLLKTLDVDIEPEYVDHATTMPSTP